jgi:hypothetical protein
MKKFVIAGLFILTICAATTMAAETTVHGRLFAHWMMNMSDGAGSYNDFGLSRAYVDVNSKLSDYTSVRITTDLRDAGGFNGYTIILKYAYMDWKPKFANDMVNLRFGLQPTMYVDRMLGIWGRRYIISNITNDRDMLTSADLGVSAMANLGPDKKTAQIGFGILNGTEYTNTTELNKQKDFNFFAAVSPLLNNPDFENTMLVGQAYMGTQNRLLAVGEKASDWKKQLFSVGGKLAYRGTLDIGFDVNMMSEGRGVGIDDRKSSAMSFFGTLYLEDLVADGAPMLRTLNLFGRFDIYDRNTDVDNDGENLMIGGVECNPIKGVKASLNLQSTSYENDAVDSDTYLFVNTEVRF